MYLVLILTESDFTTESRLPGDGMGAPDTEISRLPNSDKRGDGRNDYLDRQDHQSDNGSP